VNVPRYGYAVWWRYGRLYPDDLRFVADDSDHFVFVEEAVSVTPEGLLSPDGQPISAGIVGGKRPWRFRSSGIQVHKFIEVVNQFEALDHDNITNEQRQRRRGQLVEMFGDTTLPLFDLYADETSEDLLFLRGTLTPGSWYWIGVRERTREDDRLPVFVGATELVPSLYQPGSLEFIDRIPPYLEYRLRDIFSLAHISDVGFEEDGGEAAPPPDKPRDEPEDAGGLTLATNAGFGQRLSSQEFEA